MPHNPATWARRIAFGMDVSKPGVELHHYICAGYYSCTETGFGEMIRPLMHVWCSITTFVMTTIWTLVREVTW